MNTKGSRVSMSITRESVTDTTSGGALWSFQNQGWVTAEEDAVRWNRDHILQCSAFKAPRIVGGEVVPGARCKNTMHVGYPKWFVAPGTEVPQVLCAAHARLVPTVEALITSIHGDNWKGDDE